MSEKKKPTAKKRSHKRMDPEIKALYAICRALTELPARDARQRVVQYVTNRMGL